MKKDEIKNKKEQQKLMKTINSVKRGPNAIKKSKKKTKIDN